MNESGSSRVKGLRFLGGGGGGLKQAQPQPQLGSSCKQHSQGEKLNKNKTKHGAFVFTAAL